MPVNKGDKICLQCGGVKRHEPDCSAGDDQMFEVISAYSRHQAILDGVLVDSTQPPFDELNRNAGIRVHVAMTAEAFHAYVHPIGTAAPPITMFQNGNGWSVKSEHAAHLPSGQDMMGRYWDVIFMLRLAMQRQEDVSSVNFRLNVVPNGGGRPKLAELKCAAGTDDDGDVCLTIMLPDQD